MIEFELNTGRRKPDAECKRHCVHCFEIQIVFGWWCSSGGMKNVVYGLDTKDKDGTFDWSKLHISLCFTNIK